VLEKKRTKRFGSPAARKIASRHQKAKPTPNVLDGNSEFESKLGRSPNLRRKATNAMPKWGHTQSQEKRGWRILQLHPLEWKVDLGAEIGNRKTSAEKGKAERRSADNMVVTLIYAQEHQGGGRPCAVWRGGICRKRGSERIRIWKRGKTHEKKGWALRKLGCWADGRLRTRLDDVCAKKSAR